MVCASQSMLTIVNKLTVYSQLHIDCMLEKLLNECRTVTFTKTAYGKKEGDLVLPTQGAYTVLSIKKVAVLSFKEVYEENQERAVLEIPQPKGEE